MRHIFFILVLSIWLAPALGEQSAWGRVSAPSAAGSQAIGFYSAGCIAGAAALPLVGAGYQVMRASRNRYYGHPHLIGFIEWLGRQAEARKSRLLVGDLAQPRGGPMAYGHSSHQVGLDVDIWFKQQGAALLAPQQTETFQMESMIIAAEAKINPQRWSPFFRDMLKLSADYPEVQRIFVNPIIKQSLCRTERNRAWLAKLRPWWGHHAHFHVRLHCPNDSLQCQAQDAPPSSDGCDSDLDNWVHEIQMAALAPPKIKKAPKKKKPRALPQTCTAVLSDMPHVVSRAKQ